eukprot:g24539.t2
MARSLPHPCTAPCSSGKGLSLPQDVWDAYFLQAVREGASWCSQHNLVPQVEVPWNAMLAGKKSEDDLLRFSVGLCTATMNRLWQLKRALPLTLMHAFPYRNRCKVYHQLFATEGYAIEIDLLRVYRAEEAHWHASIGKNTAHMQACEDIVVNVDGDNLIGAGFLQDVCNRFENGAAVAQYEMGGGTCGRIALMTEVFWELGGYDEDAEPMGCQDTDMVLRVKQLQRGPHKKVKDALLSQAILNNQDWRHGRHLFQRESMETGKNRQTFQERRSQGKLTRNVEKGKIGVPVTRHWYVDGVRRLPVVGLGAGASRTAVRMFRRRSLTRTILRKCRRGSVPTPTGEFFTAEFKTFNEQNGWGFVGCDELRARFGSDVFAHNRELVNAGAPIISVEPAAKKPRLEEAPASVEVEETPAAEEGEVAMTDAGPPTNPETTTGEAAGTSTADMAEGTAG